MIVTKLTVEKAWERIEALVDRNADRNALYDRLDKLYFQENKQQTDDEGVQRIHMPYATAVIDLISDLASLMEVHIEVPAASDSTVAQREADAIEEWLRAWLSSNERKQDRNIVGEGAWLASQRAQVVARTLFIDATIKHKKDEDGFSVAGVPVVLQLRDPRNVYIEHGATGMRYVAEQWERLAGDVRELYPDALDDRVPDETEVVWSEYWDSEYRIYFVDGEAVACDGEEIVKHGYGCIPYAVGHGRTTPFRNGKRRYRPILSGVEELSEAVDVAFSILATASLKSAIATFTVFADAERDIDLSPGAVNQLKKDERLEALQRASLPTDFFQFLTMLLQAWQANTVPFNMFGQSPGDVAGYAISLLSQAGRRVIQPIWKAVQTCLAGAMINTVQICKNKVSPIIGDKVPLVVMTAGETRRIRREVKLNTADIGDDFDLEVTLDDPMPSDEAANVRMAIETTKAGLLSQQTALTKWKLVPDALGEMDRIAAESIWKQLMPLEGAKLAIERGYLPKDMAPPPGWTVLPNGMILPDALIPKPEQPEPQPQPQPEPQPMPMPMPQPQVMPQQVAPMPMPMPMPMTPGQGAAEMGLNPVDMQAMGGNSPPISLAELAGVPPTPPTPGGF